MQGEDVNIDVGQLEFTPLEFETATTYHIFGGNCAN